MKRGSLPILHSTSTTTSLPSVRRTTPTERRKRLLNNRTEERRSEGKTGKEELRLTERTHVTGEVGSGSGGDGE